MGLGSDFSALVQIPEFASAWGDVQSQLTAEGASALDVAAAQNDLAGAFDNLTSGTTGFGVSSSDALSAAKQYTIAGRTVLGAVGSVEGLLSAAQGGNPGPIFQAFTGTLIGAVTAAGAVSAGVGALIVAGIGIAIGILEKAGLFGSQPSGTQFAPGAYWQGGTPTTVIHYVATDAAQIVNGSSQWRKFPVKANAADAPWFAAWGTPLLSAGNPAGGPDALGAKVTAPKFQWKSANWETYAGYRPIDMAFPDFHYLVCQSVIAPLADFATAFTQAWIANQEYAINGLKPQDDWQVLAHFVRIWNRAHSAASFYDLGPAAKPVIDVPYQGVSGLVGSCPANLPPLYQTLVQSLLNSTAASDPILSNGGTTVRVHTGPVIKPPKVLAFHLGPPPAPSPLATTGGKIAIGTVGVVAIAAAGGSLYAFLTNQAIGYFWGKLFDGAVDGVKGLFQ